MIWVNSMLRAVFGQKFLISKTKNSQQLPARNAFTPKCIKYRQVSSGM